MRRLGGKWVLQALATAAELRLAEALETPKTAEALAKELGCHEPSLTRLLGVLVADGMLEGDSDGALSLTKLGRQLRNDELGTLARFVASPSQWTPWMELTHSVRTGDSAFEKVHGQPLFEYLEGRPDEARLYDEAVDAFTRVQARAMAEQSVLDGIETIVDVGGGRGTLLAELLGHRPHLRGVLYDRAHVVDAARERLAKLGLAERCEFVGGDFFASVPQGADAYVIKHVLHNWDDERATALLRRCAEASDRGIVLAVEGVLLPGNIPDAARLMDLEMLVLTDGGRERSKPQFRRLFAGAGLKLDATHSLGNGAYLMVGRQR